ncbi:MAG: NLP/P60 hydrolase [Rhodobacteraceae bacterium]|nr:NLP/P60 hydrolase [Paracoccaceae bacterium]
MNDARRTPINDRVIAADLSPDMAEGRETVSGLPRQIAVPVANLLRHPDGPRDRQLVWGEDVLVFETRNGWSFVQAVKDRYVGYVQDTALGAASNSTHWVSAPATHLYEAADFKSPDLAALSFGSRVRVNQGQGKFSETLAGHIPTEHLSPLPARRPDPVEVAELFLGTPYLWGGNSRWGIDCSGLVQAACLACGVTCPGDSDQQESELGTVLPDGTPPQRGDLLFWKGHVAWLCDEQTLIHANVHHMAVALEPLGSAIERIKAQGDGPVTAHKRLTEIE